MVNSINIIEKNVQSSFGYVKKDLLKLNDIVSSMQDELKHLSLNHATLLAEIIELKRQLRDMGESSKKSIYKKKK